MCNFKYEFAFHLGILCGIGIAVLIWVIYKLIRYSIDEINQ